MDRGGPAGNANTRGSWRFLMILAALASVMQFVTAAPAAAAVERYKIEMAAWIPHSWVFGPSPLNPVCKGDWGLPYPNLSPVSLYHGDGHIGFDGGYRVKVAYDFTYDGSRWSDVSVVTTYGTTRAEPYSGCYYEKTATSGGGVRSKGGGVQLWLSSTNPLAPPGTPAIDATLDVSFAGADHMVLIHRTDRFPSHGFRVWKNGVQTATAVDFDASCVDAQSLISGPGNVATGLSVGANPITHHVDLRTAHQSYWGQCGKPRPPALAYPAPRPPTPQPVANRAPVPSFTVSRLTGPSGSVRLDASGSTDSDGAVSLYRWSSAGRPLGTGKVIAASLGTATSAPVTLTVFDDDGARASLTKTVSLPNRAPVISSVSPAPGATYQNIQPLLEATASDPDGEALTYNYRFTGHGVDLTSGWVSKRWRVPAHSIDPGLVYDWTVTVRDARGATRSRTQSLRIAALPTAKRLVSTSRGAGYWQVASDGGVFSYGAAQFHGSLPGLGIRTNAIIGMARTPDDGGYWLAGSDGGVFAFGNAGFHGSMGGRPLNAPVVAMSPTPTGEGYWLVARDGGVFAFGNAGFYGSMGGRPLNAPVVAMSSTPTGKGYWLVAEDGGVFAFGDAPFFGSMGGKPLNARIVDLQVTPSGAGYWLAGADGGVFAFGDARFWGSLAGQPLNGRITSLSPTPTGLGYWMNACDGGVFAFGDAPFYGSNPVYGCRGT